MRYCINPWCQQRENEDEAETCTSCQNDLLIHQRFRLSRFIRTTLSGTEVFEAIDERGGRLWPAGTVVILKTVYASDPKRLEMFEREIRFLKFFNHPGIPRTDIPDHFQVNIHHPHRKIQCLAMSKIEGEPLNEWMAAHGRLDQQQAIAWIQQLAEIVHLIHSENLFHRDIKPDNIIVKPNGQLALIDFGGVRKFDTPTYRLKAAPVTDPSKYPDGNDITVLLSPGYTPQEQENGRATPESDFFALGRTLIHLLTGIHPTNLSEDSTGKLLWEGEALQVDPALVQFLNYICHPNWMKRPRNSQDLLVEVEKVSDYLQNKIRRQHFLRSKKFILTIFSGGVLLAYLLYGFGNLSRWLISRFYFGWAHVEEETVTSFEQTKQKYQTGLKWYADVPSYIDFGQFCQLQKDYQCALDSYNRALKLDPQSWPVLSNIGDLYDTLQDYEQASAIYQKAIDLTPNKAIEAINNQSRVLIILGKSYQAIQLANHGLSLLKNTSQNPRLRDQIQAALYKNLGWAYFTQGKNEEAFDALQQSLQLDPDLAASSCLLAQVKEKQGTPSSAIQDWLNCFQKPSTLPEVKTWQVKQIKLYLNSSVLVK